jgi:hypothetical protein
MRGLNLEADTSYTNFAAELDIDPSYLRRVLKKLKINGYSDPLHKSRKLLTPAQQRQIRSALNRNNTGTTPEQAHQDTRTPDIYDGELVLYSPEPISMDRSAALHRQNEAERSEIELRLASQMAGFEQTLLASCSGLEAAVHNHISRAVANGVSSGMNQGLAQVGSLGKPQPSGTGGG